MALPCIGFVNETAPYYGEASCALDFRRIPFAASDKSFKPHERWIVTHGFANTFDQERACFVGEVIIGRSTSKILTGCHAAEEETMALKPIETH